MFMLRVGAFVTGAVCGVSLYFAAYTLLDDGARWSALFAKFGVETAYVHRSEFIHAGVVVNHDPTQKTITIQENVGSRWNGISPDVRFTYNDDTAWSSQEYIFRDQLLQERKLREEQERPLPVGTYVSVSVIPTIRNPWTLAHVMFIRRTNL